MIKKFLQSSCILLLLISFFAFVPISQLISYGKNDTVKVGFYEMLGFFEYDVNGKESGYGVKYLEAIAKYTGLTFEYIPISDWELMSPALKDGTIDITMPVEIASKKMEWASYSDCSILETYNAILTTNSRKDLFFNDYEMLSKISIGMPKNYTTFGTLTEYLKSIGRDKSIIYYDNYNDCETALKNGEIDAVIASITDCKKDMKILKRFNLMNNYIKMRANDKNFDKINEALLSIQLDNPNFNKELFNEFYHHLSIVPYTKQEYEFMQNKKKFTVATFTDKVPISYINPSTGKFEGVAVDSLKLLEEKMDITFEFVPIEKGKKAEEMLQNNDIDMVIPFNGKQYYTGDADIFITEPLSKFDIILATNGYKNYDGNNFVDWSVGTLDDNKNFASFLKKTTHVKNIKFFDNYEDCLDDLMKDKIDVAMIDTTTLSYLVQNPHYEKIKTVPFFSFTIDYCIACRLSDNERLISVLNKAISQLDPNETRNVQTQYSVFHEYDIKLSDIIYQNRIILLISVIIITSILIISILYLKQKAKYYKKIELQSKELQQANAVKSDFLSCISHEIRTPMNAIVGISALAMDEIGNDEATKEYLKKINISSKYLEGLINDILDMAKIEKDTLKLHNEVFSITEVFINILDMLHTDIEKKKMKFIYPQNICCGEEILVYGDKLRFQQIILNLLSNAIKYTDNGGCVEVKFETMTMSEEKIINKISIKDNGVGMTEEFLQRIFKPFERENNKFTGFVNGTGLGLSIVKNVVDTMGGTIEVTSTLGVGSEFVVVLPMMLQSPSDNIVKNYEEVDYSIKLEGKRVLLVEDQSLNIEIAEKILAKKKMKIEVAQNGKIAVEKFTSTSENYYDIILMDIRMPIMNGLEATKYIRESNKIDAKTIPIVAMTANALDADIEQSKKTGINAHLTKPIDPQILYQTLIDMLAK